MNLTRAQKVRLGAFVGVSLTVLIGGVLALAGLKVWEERDVYTTRFKDNVSGLEPSATVKYQGLRVGRVESMRIAADDPESIEVTISLEAGTPLYEGTTATLDASGITGLKTINLAGGDPRRPRLAPGSRLPPGESFLDRVTGKAEAVAIKAELIANNLAKWTSESNRTRVEGLIDSIDHLVKEVDTTVVVTRDPLVETMKSVAVLSSRTAKLEAETLAAVADLRRELKETAKATRDALRAIERTANDVDGKELTKTVVAARGAMETLDRRLSDAEAGKAVADLQKALTQTTRLLDELDLTVRAGREDLVASLSYMRQAAEDLREFSRIIAQDPSVLLRGQEVRE